jgi:hypothetical protein
MESKIVKVVVIRERQNNEPPVWLYNLDGSREPDWAFFSPYDGKFVKVTIVEAERDKEAGGGEAND